MNLPIIIKLEMFLILFIVVICISGIRYLKKDTDSKIENLTIEIRNIRKTEEKGDK